MSFSASTCLTNSGTIPLGGFFNIYSNVDNYIDPFQINVTYSNLFGGNCPYIMGDVPDGTTSIKIIDTLTKCCVTINILSNNLCTTCDLDFNTYSATTIGKIVAGNITGSCDSSITDYLISWYGPDSTTNVAFTSGFGNEFIPYNHIHPLTGMSSVLVPSGIYEPIIDKVIINGLTFSQTGGTGTIPANLDCLPTFTVESLKCDDVNGGSDLTQYSHKFSYSAETGGAIPQPVSTTFELSASTNYFAWKFQGQTVPDEIKLTFIGSAYSNNPIVLDYWRIGTSGVSTLVTPTTYPRRYNTSDYFGKVIPLSGLSVTNGDNILIEMIPSTSNTQTSWTFYCGCLDEFNCDICTPSSATTVSGTTSYQFKISADTITTESFPCGVRLKLSVISDCPYSSYTGSGYYLYAPFYNANKVYLPDNKIDYGPGSPNETNLMYYNQKICSLPTPVITPTCITSGSSVTITYNKSPNLFRVISNNLLVLDTYFYQPYLSNIVPNISPFSGDNTNVGFYKYFTIQYTTATGLQTCGDIVGTREIHFHQSSVVTTGTTGPNYYIDFTMPTVTYGMPYTSCDLDCEFLTKVLMVPRINNSSTGSTNNYTGTTNQGVVLSSGLSTLISVIESLSSQTGTTMDGNIVISNYNNYTYPYSGTPATIIPSLTSQTCDISTNLVGDNSSNSYRKLYYRYDAEFYDADDLSGSFRIFAREINANGNVNLSVKTLIYELTGGVVTYTDPQYLV
jgi:hypothetical protein